MESSKKHISVILLLVLFLSSTFMMQYLQTSLNGTTMILGVDLYPRWVGTQAVLRGESPYSQATRQQIWLEIYGSTDKPDGNLFGFYYPPAITTLLMPFVLTGISANIAAILWCAFLFAILSASLIFWIIDFHNKSKGLIILPALLISGWLFRPAFSNYLLGQFALFSVLAALMAWYLLENDHPIWGGVFAALSLLKPSLTIVPIGFLFIQNRHRLKGILALIATSLILYLPPTILIGWWLPDFLADISNYSLENRVAWSAIDLTTALGLLWILMTIILVVLAIGGKNKTLTFGTAFALNVAITPHSADYDLVAFIPLLVYIGNHWITAVNKKGVLITLYFALIWFPWLSLIFFIQSVNTNAVEAWYRFIWLSFPLITMLISLLTQLSIMKKFQKNFLG